MRLKLSFKVKLTINQFKFIENLITEKSVPKSANEFKRNLNLFKGSTAKLWTYLSTVLTPSLVKDIHNKVELEPETLMLVIEAGLNRDK